MITLFKTVKCHEEVFRMTLVSLHMVSQAQVENQNVDISALVRFAQSTSNMRIANGLLLVIFVVGCWCFEEEPGMMGKIKAGFEIAGKFLGLDQTSSLAQLVSQTFAGKGAKKISDSEGTANIFSGFLRLLGLDSKKLSAIAVNAIIFVAQLISSSLSKSPPSRLTEARKLKDGTPLEWMLNNSKVLDILGDAKDSNLPNNIVEYIKERGLDEDTDCIQLLMCKSAPLVWGMQKVLNSTSKKPVKGRKALFTNLPTMDEFAKHGDICEKKHPYCLIYY